MQIDFLVWKMKSGDVGIRNIISLLCASQNGTIVTLRSVLNTKDDLFQRKSQTKDNIWSEEVASEINKYPLA